MSKEKVHQIITDRLKQLKELRNFNEPLGLNYYVVRNEGVHYGFSVKRREGPGKGPKFNVSNVVCCSVEKATVLFRWDAEDVAAQIFNGAGKQAQAVNFMEALNDDIKQTESALASLKDA